MQRRELLALAATAGVATNGGCVEGRGGDGESGGGRGGSVVDGDGIGEEQPIVTQSWHFHDIGSTDVQELEWVGALQ